MIESERGCSHLGLREYGMDVDTHGTPTWCAASFKYQVSSCVPLGRLLNHSESVFSSAMKALTFRVVLMSK